MAGFEDYADRIGKMFTPGSHVLSDLMEGLFHIAVADGNYHPAEDDFLHRVGQIFGLTEAAFRKLRARFVPDAQPDPYEVLGVSPDMSIEEIRNVWRDHVRDSHPDVMMARGLPEEAIKLAEKRLIALNNAWDEIQDLTK